VAFQQVQTDFTGWREFTRDTWAALRANLWLTLIPATAFLLLAAFSHSQLGNVSWENRQLFSVLDGSGAIVSILLGVVLLLVRPYRPAATHFVPASLALVSMGIALAAKSFTERTNVSIWLDNLDTLLGAVVFATVWFPPKWVKRLSTTKAFLVVCLISAALSGALLVYVEWLPRATEGLEFSLSTKELNLFSGILFLAVALHFLLRVHRDFPDGLAPLASICFFFGLAAVVLPFSRLWSVTWWLAQLAQFIPVLIALRFVFEIFTQSQKDLLLSEHRFKTMFSESPVGIGVVGREQTFVEANPALCRLLGYSAAELSRVPVVSLIHSADVAEMAIARKEGLASGGTYQLVTRLVSREGTPVWVRIAGTIIHDVLGARRELQLIRDISAEKAAQERINALVADLSHSNKELDRFTSMVSHDLRSPLCTITSFIQLLTRELGPKLDERSGEYFGFVIAAARRMGALIDDLLVYSRAGKATAALEPVALADVMKAVEANLAADIGTTGARLEIGQLPVVRGDRTQLMQLFQNLTGNALKYRSERAPLVEIFAKRDAENWVIEVRDNGMGFDMAEAERIFEPFRRLHGADEIPGTGLGLSICQTIVKRHEGTIRATSEVGQGSRFLVTLPARLEKKAEAPSLEGAPAQRRQG